METGFGDMFDEANAGTDATCAAAPRSATTTSVRGACSTPVVDDAAVDGVARGVLEIYGIGQIVGSDGDPLGGNGLPTQAGNWIADPEINPWQIADGRPEGPGEVVVDKASADDGDLEVGDATTIRTSIPST